MNERYSTIIIGSGVAGNAAVTELAARGTTDVLVVSADSELPYDRPPLTKEYLRGVKSADEIRFHPKTWYGEHGIELLLGTTVSSLDPAGHAIVLGNGSRIGYGKLLLTPGVAARRLAIPGSDAPNVQYLRSFADSTALKKEMAPGKRIVIIGGGFIGMEVAAACLEKGADVTVVNRGPWLWDRFVDKQVAGFFQDEYAKRGAKFLFEDEPLSFTGEGAVTAVVTKKGASLPCNTVVVGIGTILPDALFEHSGLTYDKGLIVDEYLQTSNPDIYGAGDVVSYPDPIFVGRRRVEHWGHADYTGKLAAQNMLGAHTPYDLVTYVFSDLFDLHLEFAGNEAGYDAIEILGSFANRRFTALYKQKGMTRAYFQINGTQEERDVLEKTIRKQVKRP